MNETTPCSSPLPPSKKRARLFGSATLNAVCGSSETFTASGIRMKSTVLRIQLSKPAARSTIGSAWTSPTETFTHIEQQLTLIRTRFGRPHDVALLFLHTHPFLPSVLDNMEACPTCSLRPTCTLTSSFFSQRDQTFHTAMFGATPYAVEMVLGLTPREELDLKMFCYDGGLFRERGYYQLTSGIAAT